MNVPTTTTINVPEDQAHYTAATALDEILYWFVEDGYTIEDLLELVQDRVASQYEE